MVATSRLDVHLDATYEAPDIQCPWHKWSFCRYENVRSLSRHCLDLRKHSGEDERIWKSGNWKGIRMERKGNLWGNVRIKQMSDRNRFRLILHSLDWNLGSLDNVISAIDCTSVHLTLNYCCRFGRRFRSHNKYEMPLVNFCYHHLIYRDTQLGRVGLLGVNSVKWHWATYHVDVGYFNIILIKSCHLKRIKDR